MRIIPVIDVKGGLVVHAVAGQRDRYQPVRSQLCGNARPASVASAFVREYGLDQMYVADLDAIAAQEPNWQAIEQVAGYCRRMMVDVGIDGALRATDIVRRFPDQQPLSGIVVGLESIAGPKRLQDVIEVVGEGRVVFSLDLRDGRPLSVGTPWQDREPTDIAAEVVALGITRLIVLDLARVGTGQGNGSESLCRRLRREHPSLELISGGGVRDNADLVRLQDAGCDAALVATALHQKALRVERFNAKDPPVSARPRA